MLAPSARAAEVTGIEIYPNDIGLQTNADFQNFVVVATRDDGVTLDVTKQVTAKFAQDGVARIDGSQVFPVKDGETTLEVEYLGHKSQAKVAVADSSVDRVISFHLDVMPILMRAGCNTGSCHGAKSGKDGFRLSLFGFDPNFDYHNITREIGTRRINLAVPEESLMVTKAVGSVPHTGGKRFELDSEYSQTMLEWLAAGAPRDPETPPNVTALEIYPPKAVIEGENSTQQFIARALYSDGTSRDVTKLAVFLTNNDNSAPMSEDGLVTAKARGEAFVMARFETKTVGSQVLVLPKDLQYEAPEVVGNYVDELVGAKLKRVRVLPSGLCSDEEFLRRATIDIAGMLPTEAEYREFMADTAADKRAKKIDDLLDRKEFSEIWTMKWAELLMIKSSNQVSKKSAFLYNSWLTDQIANEVPLDQMVRNLLGATGGTFTSPATNYYQLERDTLKTAENVAQVFMGIRTQCAQCHNHPFDRWTMDDYYSFAAFFAQVGRKTGEDYREQIVYNRASGDVRHLVGNRVMAPKFLGGVVPETKGRDRRQVLAEWLTAPDNPYFSKNVANRVWAHFFGIGIVEPVDDIRVSNPASNPELLHELGRRLVEYKYDFKQLVRDICNSQAYQRTTVRNASNEKDDRNFAHANVRRVPAETLLDCLSQVTNTKDKFAGLPLGARATQIADGRTSTYFLNAFGRATRETVCACESTTDPSLSQSLHMLNGSTTNSKITQGKVVPELISAEKKPEEVIESLYLRALSRMPTDDERQRLLALANEGENMQQGLEDVFWAVLNSREFLFNH
ncbi:MAG TPA: cell surface protein [Planctomycetaceae bacterium]|nr:cell surface protein [Planctomycetaceae bacterium]